MSAKKGAYLKGKTKKWLEARGYQVADLEILRWVNPPGRERFGVKRDQLGSDLLAISSQQVIFIQVKGGKKNIAAGVKGFEAFTFPQYTTQWVVVWLPRIKLPRIIDRVSAGNSSELQVTASWPFGDPDLVVKQPPKKSKA